MITPAAEPGPGGMFYVWFTLFWLSVAAVYAGSCWLRPYKRHDRCDGTGKLPRKDGKVWRLCDGWRGCNHTGRTLRFGRRLWNWTHKNRVDAK